MGSVGNQPNDVPPEDPMARWRNYQHLIWSQQQIHLQIQQQQLLQSNEDKNDDGGENHQQAQIQLSQSQELPSDVTLEEKAKELVDPWEQFDAHSAFLGPTLWDKRLPYDGHDFKLEYVDIEEFLTENGIPLDESGKHNGSTPQQPVPQNSENPPISHGFPIPPQYYAETSPHHNGNGNSGENCSITSDYASSSPSPSSSSLSPDHMTPDSTQSPSSEQTSVPAGHEFNPRMRMFSTEELKPQPMIKKSKKQFVPDDAKDAKYWMRRRKNNMAAKRSRDARRVKENQIAMRACYLEKENQFIKQEMERVKKENLFLKEQLAHYSIIEQQQQQSR